MHVVVTNDDGVDSPGIAALEGVRGAESDGAVEVLERFLLRVREPVRPGP